MVAGGVEPHDYHHGTNKAAWTEREDTQEPLHKHHLIVGLTKREKKREGNRG